MITPKNLCPHCDCICIDCARCGGDVGVPEEEPVSPPPVRSEERDECGPGCESSDKGHPPPWCDSSALRSLADRVERLAFEMPAPNQYTPRFVEIAVAARAVAINEGPADRKAVSSTEAPRVPEQEPPHRYGCASTLFMGARGDCDCRRTEQEPNQCDGCRRGLRLVRGDGDGAPWLHSAIAAGGGAYDFIACTAHLYGAIPGGPDGIVATSGPASPQEIYAKALATPTPPEPRSDGGLPDRVLDLCSARGWDMHWTSRGAYLHLESSELIEALRGKRGSVLGESADVLIVLMSITQHAGIAWADVLAEADRKVAEVVARPPLYHGEAVAQQASPSLPDGFTAGELELMAALIEFARDAETYGHFTDLAARLRALAERSR